MPKLINLRPIQTGDACYLQNHHNREGECIITVVMNDACYSAEHALFNFADQLTGMGFDPSADAGGWDVAKWCAEQWQLAQADMPAETDRDTRGRDEERYLECHILATWKV